MASSSLASRYSLCDVTTSKPKRNWLYDVFPSFSGEDVRVTFLSHLIKELERKLITTFIDHKIKRGQSLDPELRHAIKNSRIAVVVLSKNYASSTWCLNELLEILHCKEERGQTVIPVFYGLDPSHVRKQTGEFGEIFNKTCKNQTEEVKIQWKEALTNVDSSPAINHSNSSLFDVMRRDRRRDKTAWKSLRDKLRFKRTATDWISSNPIPNLDNPIPNLNNESNRFNRLGFLLSTSETNRRSGDGSEGAVEGRRRLGTVLAAEREEMQPPRMSLMELLEDNDGQMYDVSEREEAEAEAEAEAGGKIDCGGGEVVTVTGAAELGCCVCMIRSKGAAFIPCGHTFCRLCSRELWVQRGNCPLCNTTILQVLDIF